MAGTASMLDGKPNRAAGSDGGRGGALRRLLGHRLAGRRGHHQADVNEVLRRSEHRLRVLVQNSSQVVATLDEQGTITYMSPSIERLTGWPPEHYVGTELGVHAHPDDPVDEGLDLSRAERGSVHTARRRIRRWDGGFIWVESTRTNLLDEPAIEAIVLNIRDVSEEEEALAALRASEDRYRRIVEGAQEAILVVDRAGAVIFANGPAERLLGSPAGGPLARSLEELGLGAEAAAAFLGEGASGSSRREVPLHDDDDRCVEVASDALLDDEGEVVGHLVLAADVTERRRAQDQLRVQARLLESVGEAVFAVDPDGATIYCNAAAEVMLGFARSDVLGAELADLAPAAQREQTVRLVETLRHRQHWSGEVTLTRADGSRFPALMTTSPVLDDLGRSMGTIFVAADLTGKHAAADELASRASQHAAVADVGKRALVEGDPASFLHSLLATATEQLGVDRASLFELDETTSRLVLRAGVGVDAPVVGDLTVPAGPDDVMGFVLAHGGPLAVEDFGADETFGAPTQLLELGVRSGIAVVVGGHDRPYGLLAIGSGVVRAYSQQEIDFVRSLANVLGAALERDRSEAELLHQATHDPLTDLANRSVFESRLRAAMEAPIEVDAGPALLLLDLDGLKLVNDALGLMAGDQVLVGAAQRLEVVTGQEASVARLGGDGFAVLVSATDGAAAVALGERISAALHEPFIIHGAEVFVTGSIGVALAHDLPDGDVSSRASALLRQADLAVKAAKAMGKGRVERFDHSLLEDAAAKLVVATALRGANERGELQLHYQPTIHLETGDVAVEALLRWDHPTLGSVPPARFIPIAEESGTIVEIGSWVLDQAFTQLRAWEDEPGLCPRLVSVNLSPRQVAQPDIVELVAAALRRHHVTPGAVCLEVTETAMMADPAGALRTVERLRDLGVDVAIDDFGTGFSSLAHLRRFPVTSLKVDRSFVAGLDVNESDRSIVAAVIGLAHAMDLVAVAEGVETEAQLAVLREMGCDVGQGFLWSPALPPDELLEWLRARRAGADLLPAPD